MRVGWSPLLIFKQTIMSQSSNKRVLTGGIFLVVGSLLLLDNLDIFNFRLPDYFFHWYSIMIMVGIFFATNNLRYFIIAVFDGSDISNFGKTLDDDFFGVGDGIKNTIRFFFFIE